MTQTIINVFLAFLCIFGAGLLAIIVVECLLPVISAEELRKQAIFDRLLVEGAEANKKSWKESYKYCKNLLTGKAYWGTFRSS
jgi:hypothetical protein